MGKNKQQVPRLRFPGFNDTWEQRKLGDVVDIVGGGTPETTNSAYWNGDIDWYSPTEIGAKVYANGSVKKITTLGLEKSSAKILPANKTILFTSRAGIGDMAILQKQGATNQGFQSFIVRDGINIYFLYSMGKRIKDFALKNASGSTFLEVSKNQLVKMDVFMPSEKEQIAIGNFFRQLDEAIASHQRKLERVKELKKSLLQKMFPKDGEAFPELRFPNFTDAWEQRKLGDVLQEEKRPVILIDEYNYELLTVKRRNAGIVSRGRLRGKEILVKNYFSVKCDDYVISKRQVIHGANGLVPSTLDNAIVSNEYLVLISNHLINTQFLSLLSARKEMYKHFFLSSYGIDIEKLVFDFTDFRKRKIYLPSLSEQTAIGNFFRQLDEAIASHQRKLEHMQALKKGLLQQMFV
ncbi:restriction endonuclease subunit S [Uruburuella suis]|uniref:Restriction endonuclease subunit S n=1 Tax=Uruburuella suis TaxID=252130 RepID=A0AAE9GRJ6_9NEIS|nr:restriction endonuclease subunit S [Uruburuella suis]TCP07787.1 type I restriction enzyme S subunit [Uruburuella suis]UOO78710.1 restriction endonuclease subunit S [Uruburuella suis]